MSKLTHYTLLIRGGTVIDGTKTPRFTADIGISDGRITAIGNLTTHTADETLDASGVIVAPRLHRRTHPRRPGLALARRHDMQALPRRDHGDRGQLRNQPGTAQE